MLRTISVQNRTFIYYSLLIMVIIVILASASYFYIYRLLLEKTTNGLEKWIENVSSQLETMVREMDIVSNQVAFSRDMQNYMIEAKNFSGRPQNYFDLNIDAANNAQFTLLSINTSKLLARRIMVFNQQQSYISVGAVSEDLNSVKSTIQNAPWVKEVITLKGRSLILPPHLDDWIDPKTSQQVISITRPIYATYTTNDLLGIVEVQKPYDILEEILQINPENHMKAIVFNEQGKLVYPIQGIQDREISYYRTRALNPDTMKGITLQNSLTHEKEIIFTLHSSYTGWSVLLAQPEKEFLSPIYGIQKVIYIAGFLFLLLTLIAIFWLTHSLTAPIRALRNSVNRVSLENLSLGFKSQAGHNEIIQLNDAYNEMLNRLKDSINQAMLAKTSEMHAHFLSLQAQMTPHFLYNTLMGISAVGQELNSMKIISMCSELSDMLRYVGSFENSHITLKDELTHAENYLKLIKWRCEDRLHYEFIVEEAMYNLKVPKLILQPLIENCFSHGFDKVRPPWNIKIHGKSEKEKWEISVVDNGSGFSEKSLEKIQQQMLSLQKDVFTADLINHLKPGGMSIFNILIRFKLFFGDNAVFIVKNDPITGTTVTLGGNITYN